ncbi:MAG: SAM-dependent methyltransferase, partial [Acidobacteriota bacterium]
MGVRADARVLLAMVKGAGGAGAHAERLTRFYGPQAADYDRFRERLLPGRRELVEALPVTAGARVVELGGGTGRNAEFFGARLDTLARLDVVDICAPLLEVASARFTGRTNVRCT